MVNEPAVQSEVTGAKGAIAFGGFIQIPVSITFSPNFNFNFKTRDLDERYAPIHVKETPNQGGQQSADELAKTNADDSHAPARSGCMLRVGDRDYPLLLPTPDMKYAVIAPGVRIELTSAQLTDEFRVALEKVEEDGGFTRMIETMPALTQGKTVRLRFIPCSVTLNENSAVINVDSFSRSYSQIVVLIDITDEHRGVDYLAFFWMDYKDEDASQNIPSEDDRALVISSSDKKSTYVLCWPPDANRLGDGSYGVVYKVYEKGHNAKFFALKILYERQFSDRSGLIDVSGETILALKEGDSKREARDGATGISGRSVHVSEVLSVIDTALKKYSGDKNVSGAALKDLSRLVHQCTAATSRSTDLANLKYREECTVDEKIRETISRMKASNQRGFSRGSAYVSIENHSNAFKSSAMYRALRNYYGTASNREGVAENQTFNLSSYCIVMELCSGTLRELLEREWILTGNSLVAKENRSDLGESNHSAVLGTNSGKAMTATDRKTVLGYHLIRQLPYNARLETVWPFLDGAANGLLTLHTAGLRHHDVKPGNVFYTEYSGDRFETLVGDFSFVARAVESGSTEELVRDVISTGTVHFRSPEQRDFAGKYYASLVHLQDGVGVRVIDPKFEESLGREDRIVFSRDNNGRVYKILDVRSSASGVGFDIALDASFKSLMQSAGIVDPTGDERTLVTCFKVPGIQSDIFGFGALAYDLITGGESAEKFYEDLQIIDRDPLKGRKLKDILVSYRNCSEGGFRARLLNKLPPEEQTIFNHFENGSIAGDWCPPWMVEIVLQCMLTKVPGSICFDAGKHERERRGISELRGDDSLFLKKISKLLDAGKTKLEREAARRMDKMDENLLFSPMTSPFFDYVLKMR